MQSFHDTRFEVKTFTLKPLPLKNSYLPEIPKVNCCSVEKVQLGRPLPTAAITDPMVLLASA